MIPFTDRELERAWRENFSASESTQRNNPLRLLLFYAVECGLKAIIMKRSRRRYCRTDDFKDIEEAKHDINKLLDSLKVSIRLRLPHSIKMRHLFDHKKQIEQRDLSPGKINEMWRYGGSCFGDIKDEDLEKQLISITNWIRQELT